MSNRIPGRPGFGAALEDDEGTGAPVVGRTLFPFLTPHNSPLLAIRAFFEVSISTKPLHSSHCLSHEIETASFSIEILTELWPFAKICLCLDHHFLRVPGQRHGWVGLVHRLLQAHPSNSNRFERRCCFVQNVRPRRQPVNVFF